MFSARLVSFLNQSDMPTGLLKQFGRLVPPDLFDRRPLELEALRMFRRNCRLPTPCANACGASCANSRLIAGKRRVRCLGTVALIGGNPLPDWRKRRAWWERASSVGKHGCLPLPLTMHLHTPREVRQWGTKTLYKNRDATVQSCVSQAVTKPTAH